MSDRRQHPYSRFQSAQLRSAHLAFCGWVLCTSILAAGTAGAQEPDADLIVPDSALGNSLGMGLAADADRIIAGAPGTAITGYAARSPALSPVIKIYDGVGAFVIYRDDVSEWTVEQYVPAPFGSDPTFSAEPGVEPAAGFGTAVAIDGDLALVSAPGARLTRYGDPDESPVYKKFGGEGIVYAYEYDAGASSWAITQMLTNVEVPYGRNSFNVQMAQSRFFGHALALASDWLAVSSPGDILGVAGGRLPPNYPVELYEYVSTPGPSTPACASISYAYSLPAPLDPFPTYPCWVEMGSIDPPAVEYDLADGPVTTVGTTSTIDIEVDGAEPSSPKMRSGDEIYLTGLSGTVGGVVTSELNNNWWSITSTSKLNSQDKVRINIAPHVSTGAASGGGNSGKYYRYYQKGETVDFKPAAFGAAIAFDPDADVLAVGAPFENTKTGAVHVYRRDGTGAFVFDATLIPSDSAEYDLFGVSVVAELDRLAVGAQLKPCVVAITNVSDPEICAADSNGHLVIGAVYIFDYDTGTGSWSEVEKILPPTEAAYQLFGTSLALDGDDLLVGTPGTVLDEIYQGSVHRYRDNGSAFEWIEEIEGPSVLFDAAFGARVTIRGDDVIASSPNLDHDPGAAQGFKGYYTGEVFVYSNQLASTSPGGSSPTTGPEPGVLSGWAALVILGCLARRRRRTRA